MKSSKETRRAEGHSRAGAPRRTRGASGAGQPGRAAGSSPPSFIDRRDEAVRQRQVQLMGERGPQASRLTRLQHRIDEHLAARARHGQPAAVASNAADLPGALRAGVETLSGVAMDDVKVHYNSPRPAQLRASAYTQGATIHVAPGQERHLPHEAWHVVQQKQGRVPATTRFDGVAINDDRGLEHEADAKGAAAARLGARPFQLLAPRNVSSIPWVTQRVCEAGGAVVQRRITIGGEAYTHASRRVNTLFDEVVTPALEQEGYKLYGIKSQLVEFIRQYREAPRAFADGGEFLRAFFPWLGDRVRPTRGSPTPVLKKFEVGRMSRPAWPKDYSSKLGAQSGDNIRHVVRNATLKRALVIEAARLKSAPLAVQKKYFAAMAGLLGVSLSEGASLDVILPAIYRVLYLNEDNLFAGDGPTNQIIGFAADGIRVMGEEYLGMGDALVDMIEVNKRISYHIYAQAEKVRANPYYKEYIISRLQETILESLKSLVDANDGGLQIPAEIVGDLVADMGLNFGFDLIDGRRDEDSVGIAERQARLLRVERALQAYIERGGQGASLLKIFGEFLGKSIDIDLGASMGKGLMEILKGMDSVALEKLAKQYGASNSGELVEKLKGTGRDQLAMIGKSVAQTPRKRLDPVAVDTALGHLGFVRGGSDAFEFVCLIDSIHQQLNYLGLGVDRALLIERVREATGTDVWQMLDILGAQGAQVLRAVENVVHAAHGAHVQFDVNVFMTMPDSSVVPFLDANQFRGPHGGAVHVLNLLFINNNHYEPLFGG